MANAEQVAPYELIETIPESSEDRAAELTRHSEVYAANTNPSTYDTHRARVIALANINMLLDGVVSREAMVHASESVGEFGTM